MSADIVKAVVAAAALVAVSGCAGAETSERDIQSFVGEPYNVFITWDAVSEDLPAVITQDVSEPVLGLEPSFTGDDLYSSTWVIAALCSDTAWVGEATSLEVAVVPAQHVDEELRARLQTGDDSEGLVTCEGRPYRAP